MPTLYSQLHRRYGKPDGISRREMIQRSLAAAGALLLSDRFGLSAQPRAGRVVVIGAGFSGLAAALRAVARRLRRHRRRGAQPRRRAGDQLFRSRAREERRGRRRADRIEPSRVGRLREAVRPRVPRRRRGGPRVPHRAERQAPLRRRVRGVVGGDGEGVQHARRGRREGGRRPAVDRRRTPPRSTAARWRPASAGSTRRRSASRGCAP